LPWTHNVISDWPLCTQCAHFVTLGGFVLVQQHGLRKQTICVTFLASFMTNPTMVHLGMKLQIGLPLPWTHIAHSDWPWCTQCAHFVTLGVFILVQQCGI